jgi:hypothetical protein
MPPFALENLSNTAKSNQPAEHTERELHRDAHPDAPGKNQSVADAIPNHAATTDTASKFLTPMCIISDEKIVSDEKNSGKIKMGDVDPTDKLRVGMAWSNATNLDEPAIDSMARHDIVIGAPGTFRLKANNEYPGLATSFTSESIVQGDKMHQQLKDKNPGIETLAEVRYRDASSSYLPEDSPWWQRDNKGKFVAGYPGAGLNYRMLDFTNPKVQDQVADQAAALVKSGAVDGVMLDWFNDGVHKGKDPDDGVHKGKDWDAARLEMLTKIREKIDEVNPKAKIFINTNAKIMPDSIAKLVDGYYMECNMSSTRADWDKITNAVDHAEKQGKTVFVETWFDKNMSRQEDNKMRATMALVMTHAPDGVALFGDPDGLKMEEHQHDFYNFYNTKIGKPVGELVNVGGTSQRDFERGTFVYNPIGNGNYEMHFAEPHTSAATGKRGTSFCIRAENGDFFSE